MTARGLDAGIGDLLLTVIAEALSRLLRSRGEETAGRMLRVTMPRAQQPAQFSRAVSKAQQNWTAAISLDVPIGPATPEQRRLARADGQRKHHYAYRARSFISHYEVKTTSTAPCPSHVPLFGTHDGPVRG